MKVSSLILAGALPLLLLVAQAPRGLAEEPLRILLHEDFHAGLGRWKVVKLGAGEGTGSAGITSESGSTHFMRITSRGSFLGLGIDEQFNPASYPDMGWRWRVAKFPDNADIRSKSADDAAARLYVVFNDRDLLHPFGTSALVYVWDTRYPVGRIIANPYAPRREKAIVIESGPSRSDGWRPEQVNLAADYQRAFGRQPGSVKAIVFASDSDNTHSASSSDLADLTISGGPRAAALGVQTPSLGLQ